MLKVDPTGVGRSIATNTSRRHIRNSMRGKNAYKYFMFKNPDRRKSLKRANTTLNVFSVLASIAFGLGVAMFAFGAVAWFMVFIFTLGLSTKTNWLGPYFSFAAIYLLITAIIFLIVLIIKFVVEWGFILRETRELKQEPEENENYLAVASAVKKVKLMNFLMLILISGLLIAVAAILIGSGLNTGTQTNALLIVALVVIILALILNKVYSYKKFSKIQDNIEEIKVVLRKQKAERKEEQELLFEKK